MPFEAMIAVVCIFVGLPWLILHYMTKWKQAPKITDEDEKMLDEMYILARRLEARVETVERIVAADSPDLLKGPRGSTSDYRDGFDAPRPNHRLEGRN